MAQPKPETLAHIRHLVAKDVAAHFESIERLVKEAHLSGDAFIVVSEGQPVDVLEWARIVVKMALEDTPR